MLDKHIWRDFIAVTVGIALVGIGLGCTLPLTALVLTARGYGPNVIGSMVAAAALGGVAGTFLTPSLVDRCGRRGVMLGCFILAALSVAALQTVTSIPLWMSLRFLFGFAMAALFLIGESWINILAGDAARGRVVALYTTSFTLFQVLGPLFTDWLSNFPNDAFYMCGLLFLLGIPGIASTRPSGPARATTQEQQRSDHNQPSSWFDIARHASVILAGTAFFASFDSIVLSFLPLVAINAGFTQSRALAASAIVLGGDAALQYLAGWMSDHFGRDRVHRCAGVAVCLLLPLLPLMMHLPVIWEIYLFLLGGCAGAVYTLSMVASGHYFRGTGLLRVAGLIGLAWNISSSLGPAATGLLMQHFGSAAMVAVLWAMSLVFVLLTFKGNAAIETE